MINGRIEDFLDTGWYNEATLFYKGNIYWCEGFTDSDSHVSTFFVDKWAAQKQDDMYYNELRTREGELLNHQRVLQISADNLDKLKQKFLMAPIFEGKTFWQVEKEVAWLDEGKPIVKDNDTI